MRRYSSHHVNVVVLLPLVAGLWLGYLLLLLLVDYLLFPQPIFPHVYYLVNGLAALAVLGLALWPRGRTWLGQFFLPLVIGLLSVVPVVLSHLMVAQQPHGGPANSAEAMLLRTMPLLLLALILIVWQYGWRYVMLFSGGIAVFTLGVHLYLYQPGGPPLLPPVIVLIIQTISFVLVGYFINVLLQQLRQQNEALARANAQLTNYTVTLEELTISRERNRMARELHDTLAHTLSALSIQLETAKAYWEVDPAATADIIDASLAATRSGLQETRQALKSLRASPLDDMGLLLALQQLARETAERANLRLNLSMPTSVPALPQAIEQCLYRVAQEATANVAYHANARTMMVQLTVNGSISLQISDDGQGFNPQQAVSAGHFGLAGMRERAALVGGELTITSHPGAGAIVQFVVNADDTRPLSYDP